MILIAISPSASWAKKKPDPNAKPTEAPLPEDEEEGSGGVVGFVVDNYLYIGGALFLGITALLIRSKMKDGATPVAKQTSTPKPIMITVAAGQKKRRRRRKK